MRAEGPGFYLGLALVLYLVLSGMVFAFRHPWMSDTERFLHMREVLTWQRVPRERR